MGSIDTKRGVLVEVGVEAFIGLHKASVEGLAAVLFHALYAEVPPAPSSYLGYLTNGGIVYAVDPSPSL